MHSPRTGTDWLAATDQDLVLLPGALVAVCQAHFRTAGAESGARVRGEGGEFPGVLARMRRGGQKLCLGSQGTGFSTVPSIRVTLPRLASRQRGECRGWR